MNRIVARALAAGISLTVGAVASATPPVKLDSEQKAAASLITALHTSAEGPLYHYAVIERVIFYTNRALATASAVTTPAALMAAPTGITVPCEASGSMTARMAPRYPRVFKFEWHDCKFDMYGWPHSLDGPGEVILLSDTLTPTKVAGIRFGNGTTDLIQTRELVTFDQINHDTLRRNLIVAGSVPLTITQYVAAGTTTSFAYVINGFVDETNVIDFPQSGAPQQIVGTNFKFDTVAYTGSFGYNDDASRYDEDLSGLFGTFTLTRRDPAPYGVTSERYRFDGFRVHHITDWAAFDSSLSIDGKLNYTWNPNFGAGCVSGEYSFKTAAPLHNSLNFWQQYDSGDLLINGAARFTFYSAANVPAGLPVPTQGMLVHDDVKNVGAFNYDTSAASQGGVRTAAGCM